MNRLNLILISIVIAALGIFLVYHFVWNKAKPDYAGLEPDFTVSAPELYREFTENSTAASAKYNGKMILLTGGADRLEKVDSLVIAVYVFNEGMFGDEGIRCTFLSSVKDEITETSLKGVSIKGYCAGYNDVDVVLEKCTLKP